MPTKQTIVIVGAGLAGAKAAETLRAEGFDGRLRDDPRTRQEFLSLTASHRG